MTRKSKAGKHRIDISTNCRSGKPQPGRENSKTTVSPEIMDEENSLEEAGISYPYDVLKKARNGTNIGFFNVYVIVLHQQVKSDFPGIVGRQPNLPAVYVGQSRHQPMIRFGRHLAGKFASDYVTKYGLKLLPELYDHYNPLQTRQQALEVEAALAEKLRRLGYTVLGGH